jgi:hypothetical protein
MRMRRDAQRLMEAKQRLSSARAKDNGMQYTKSEQKAKNVFLYRQRSGTEEKEEMFGNNGRTITTKNK